MFCCCWLKISLSLVLVETVLAISQLQLKKLKKRKGLGGKWIRVYLLLYLVFEFILVRMRCVAFRNFTTIQNIDFVAVYDEIEFDLHFYFLNRGIILWIELRWPENPANTYPWHTETLDSCFDLIRSHQQCIPWSPDFLVMVIQFTILFHY